MELKYLDSDEFDHWVGPDAFGATARTLRKLREWEVFHDARARAARTSSTAWSGSRPRRSTTTSSPT